MYNAFIAHLEYRYTFLFWTHNHWRSSIPSLMPYFMFYAFIALSDLQYTFYLSYTCKCCTNLPLEGLTTGLSRMCSSCIFFFCLIGRYEYHISKWKHYHTKYHISQRKHNYTMCASHDIFY